MLFFRLLLSTGVARQGLICKPVDARTQIAGMLVGEGGSEGPPPENLE